MQLLLSSSISRGLFSIFCFFYYSLFIFEIWKGWVGCNPRNPPLDPPMLIHVGTDSIYLKLSMNLDYTCIQTQFINITKHENARIIRKEQRARSEFVAVLTDS